MAHPYSEHYAHKVQRRRVADMTRGYASGGAVSHDDAAADRKLFHKMLNEHERKDVDGAKSRYRADRHAKGGRVKHKGTNVNVIVAGHGGVPPPNAGPVPMPAGPSPIARPPVPLPVPPAAGPGLPPGGPPPMGLPGGMPMRRSGGRTFAKGGRVAKQDGGRSLPLAGSAVGTPAPAVLRGGMPGAPVAVPPMVKGPLAKGGRISDGPAWKESRAAGTQVQHSGNKMDGKDIGRGKAITYKTGGPVEHPSHGGMAPKFAGGGRGGLARIAKAHRAAKLHK